MSVPAGAQAAYRTDSHGHRPQNRLTCANRQAELCASSASSQGGRVPRRTSHSPAAAITPYRHGPVRYPSAPDTRTPQADRALASPTKLARQRPTDRARDLDPPAMYPGGTWHPPPVDPRNHRASPSDADACDSADVSEFRHRILMQRPASPFVISNAVRGTWLGAGTPPSGGPDRRLAPHSPLAR